MLAMRHVCKADFDSRKRFLAFHNFFFNGNETVRDPSSENGCAHENTPSQPRVDDPVDRGDRCARNHDARCMRPGLWVVVGIGYVGYVGNIDASGKPERRNAIAIALGEQRVGVAIA